MRVMEHAPEGTSGYSDPPIPHQALMDKTGKFDPPSPPDRSGQALGRGAIVSKMPVPYKIYNIGNNSPVQLMDFIRAIENELKKTAVKKFLPLQPGDVPATYADVSDLVNDLGYKPETTVKEGIKRFVEWYLGYYK